MLAKSYFNVFTEYCSFARYYGGSEQDPRYDHAPAHATLRLLPISGGILAGEYASRIAELSMAALSTACSQLPEADYSFLLDCTVHLCVFIADEFDDFCAAKCQSDPLDGQPRRAPVPLRQAVFRQPASRPVYAEPDAAIEASMGGGAEVARILARKGRALIPPSSGGTPREHLLKLSRRALASHPFGHAASIVPLNACRPHCADPAAAGHPSDTPHLSSCWSAMHPTDAPYSHVAVWVVVVPEALATAMELDGSLPVEPIDQEGRHDGYVTSATRWAPILEALVATAAAAPHIVEFMRAALERLPPPVMQAQLSLKGSPGGPLCEECQALCKCDAAAIPHLHLAGFGNFKLGSVVTGGGKGLSVVCSTHIERADGVDFTRMKSSTLRSTSAWLCGSKEDASDWPPPIARPTMEHEQVSHYFQAPHLCIPPGFRSWGCWDPSCTGLRQTLCQRLMPGDHALSQGHTYATTDGTHSTPSGCTAWSCEVCDRGPREDCICIPVDPVARALPASEEGVGARVETTPAARTSVQAPSLTALRSRPPGLQWEAPKPLDFDYLAADRKAKSKEELQSFFG